MFRRRITFRFLATNSLIVVLAGSVAIKEPRSATFQDETKRSIIADEFIKRRPRQVKSDRPKRSATYTLTKAATRRSDQPKLQVGVTIWRFEPAPPGTSNGDRSVLASYWNREDWMPKRVEADVKFRRGDILRISIESPRNGYLYVVNRDVFADGTFGETNLIFPTLGDDNRLAAGKLIDIPRETEPPFQANPKPDQSSELLTIIVTSYPLPLQLGDEVIPISKQQLKRWEERWGGDMDQLEMNGGAGQVRTLEEQLAASRMRSRQLTRDDPMPQTIYSLYPRNTKGLLFNLALSYGP